MGVSLHSGIFEGDNAQVGFSGPIFQKRGRGSFRTRYVATHAHTRISIGFGVGYYTPEGPFTFPTIIIDNFSMKEVEKPKIA